jgi:hypothetical protein
VTTSAPAGSQQGRWEWLVDTEDPGDGDDTEDPDDGDGSSRTAPEAGPCPKTGADGSWDSVVVVAEAEERARRDLK